MRSAVWVALGLLLLLPGHLWAKEVGEVVALERGAWVSGAGGKTALSPAMRLSMDDVIETDAVGSAQLLFDDGTKIAIGPRSKLIIDDVLMRSSGKASRFAVNAVSGSMRFISGKSAKSAYSITTPTATMGIRGTAFEVSVNRSRETDLVLFNGAVQFCGASGCRIVESACAAVKVTSFGGFEETEDDTGKVRLIQRRFPLIVQQGDLRREFRLPIERCGDRVASEIQRAAEPKREGTPAPEPPAPPDDI